MRATPIAAALATAYAASTKAICSERRRPSERGDDGERQGQRDPDPFEPSRVRAPLKPHALHEQREAHPCKQQQHERARQILLDLQQPQRRGGQQPELHEDVSAREGAVGGSNFG